MMWLHPGEADRISAGRRLVAGFLGGFILAADYSGVVILIALYGYVLVSRLSTASWPTAFRESLVFVAGSVPPVLFLLYSQWVMYGNPFMPGQYWMPEVNYTDQGWRGFSWPAPGLFLRNLFEPSYGMYVFGPLLILGLVPARIYREETLVLPIRERRFVVALVLAFMVFCAANQYSRMQFNTGFRYLVPLVPFIYLAAADHLARIPARWLAPISVIAVVNSWVLTVFRESVHVSWQLFLTEGIQLPWLRVLRMTSALDSPVFRSPLVPVGLLVAVLVLVMGLWWYGSRLRESQAA
jgi:hypothetical protein